MPVFKKFGPGDQIDNVLVLEPKFDLASGSEGWAGSPEGSASLSLYGGSRRRSGGIFRRAEYQSMVFHPQIGNPTRTLPMTASVNIVWATDEELNLAQRNHERWGAEHWRPLMRLHDEQRSTNVEFVTSSYDYYSLYFQGDSENVVNVVLAPESGTRFEPTGSFTLESWLKPFKVTDDARDFTIQSHAGFFWLGLTGSTGRLTFSSSLGIFTSSVAPTVGRWSHAAVVFDGTSLTGTFYLNLGHAGDFLAGPLSGTADTLWSIGNVISASVDPSNEDLGDRGFLSMSFHGMLGEQRYWDQTRTWSQLSSSFDQRLTGSELSSPIGYLPFSDGPLTSFTWPGSYGLSDGAGSGTLNLATRAWPGGTNFAKLMGFDRSGPVWLPNDNRLFHPSRTVVRDVTSGTFEPGSSADQSRTEDLRRMLVIDIPSAFSGRQISPGSVRIIDRSWSDPRFGLVRVLCDDGRGGLYVSGSMFSASLADEEHYDDVSWRKVGNVFYSEGLITIKDPALHDLGRIDGSSSHPRYTFQLSFRGTTKTPVKTLMCRIDRGELNATLNPTFYTVDEAGNRIRNRQGAYLYITTVGVYNSDRELVGIARLADPIRIRPRDRLNIRLRMDF